MGILAIILSIVAVLCALLATMLFGNVGLIIAIVVAVAAIILAFLKRSKSGQGGIAAIVIGALAIILAFSVNGMWKNAFKTLHETAVQYKPDGLWAQVDTNTDGGLMGLMKNLPSDEAALNAMVEEMNELNKLPEK